MAMHWAWSWSWGLASTVYSGTGQFTLSSTVSVVTNSAANLLSHVPGSPDPGQEFNLSISSTANLITPPFKNGAVSSGWFCLRHRNPQQQWNGSSNPFVQLRDGTTVRVSLAPASSSAIFSLINVFVNSTLVGTSSRVMGDQWATYAVDFDLTTTPPEAGLVIDGVREVARGGGIGTPTTADRFRLSSGGNLSGTMTLGDPVIFNSLVDLTDRTSQDVWVAFLDPNAATDPDASWTPTGGTLVGVLADSDTATYDESSGAPDTITVGCEAINDRAPLWNPTVIYGLAAVSYSVDTLASFAVTLDLRDAANNSAGTNVDLIGVTPQFLGVWAAVDGSAAAWTEASIDASTLIYSFVV